MSIEADPQLLSMLQKVANPLKSLNLQFSLKGVFAPPQQWKITDENNPNIFGYTIEVLGKCYQGGKIQPKKLTEKELKQLEQQKNKKGAKKETKQQQKPPIVDPQAQRKKLEWEKLSQQEKFYRTSEDPYQMFSLKFQQQNISIQLDNQQVRKFENQVDKGYLELYLIRKPDINQEEINKLKKAKPKTLNLGELYTAKYKGLIDLRNIAIPGGKNISQRVKFQFDGELPAQCIKIQTEKCYAFIQITLDQSIIPKVQEIKPETNTLYPEFNKNTAKKDTSSIQRLKVQIFRAIKAISQQYILCFVKEKQHQDDRRHSSLGGISTLRLNQINKKKQQFLNEFINNGKYSILKDRISQTIKAICIDKFRKEKQNNIIDKSTIHQTLSQLNVYFQQQFNKAVDQFMQTQSHLIHQDLVLAHENSRQFQRQAVAQLINETSQQKELRLAAQYQIINSVDEAQKNYLNLIIINNEDVPSLFAYTIFCLKNHKFDNAYILLQKIVKKSSDLSYKLILAILTVRRRRTQQVLNIITQLIQSQQSTIDNKIIYNQLLSFMYQRQSNIKLSQKYLALVQKYYQIKQNPNLKLNPLKNPYQQIIPKIPKPLRYTSQLNNQQSQQIKLKFINILAQYYIYDLVQQYLNKIAESNRKQILTVQALIFKQKYSEALNIIDKLIQQNPKSIDLLLIKADICYKADKMFQSQQIFLYLLKLKPTANQTYSIYLRLGFTYLNRKSWEDAQSIFFKACELKNNSSLSWLGLGIAHLNLGKIQEAEQALDVSSIYNPLGHDCQKHLKRVRQIQLQKNKEIYKYLGEVIS